jgi:putative Mn2+ efflux pump MntP
MSFLYIVGIALALAMDAFAVSVGVSLSLGRINQRQIFRLAIHFGLFQFMMPVAGWLAGRSILVYIEAVDHWVAFGLLLAIGGRMIRESLKPQESKAGVKSDPTKGLSLFILSVATSVDALAVGLSFGVLGASILLPAAVIGLVAFIMTVIGTMVGPHLSRIFGKRAELLGGITLIIIGVKILVDHL